MHEKASRIGPPPHTEKGGGTEKETRGDPPPSPVQKRHRTRVGIQKINGYAVGDGYRQEHTGVGSGMAVRRSLRFPDALPDVVMDDDPRFVDLTGVHDGLERGSAEQALPPLRCLRGRRITEQSEIERIGAGSGVRDSGKHPPAMALRGTEMSCLMLAPRNF